MTKRWMTAAAVLLFAAPAYAQTVDPQCAPVAGQPANPNSITSDACQKAVDLYKYMMPQLGTSLTGASAIVNQGGSLGGLGHFAVDIRVNGLQGSLPQVNESGKTPSQNGPVATSYNTKDQPIGLPSVNLAVGLFKGIPLGLTNVGGVDALLTGTYVPKVSGADVSIDPKSGSFKLGYGVRVGLLQESLLLPGVSASWMQRDLPTTDITATTTSGGSTTDFQITDFTEKTQALRLSASKSLALFRLSAGVGQDKYKSSASVSATTNYAGIGSLSRGPVAMDQEITRTLFYGGVGLNLLAVKLGIEAGVVQGGDVKTYNQFDKPADKSRLFGTVGLRFGF